MDSFGRDMKSLEKRVKVLEDDVEMLKRRPVSSGEVDFTQICMREEYLELLERVKGTEKRNLE